MQIKKIKIDNDKSWKRDLSISWGALGILGVIDKIKENEFSLEELSQLKKDSKKSTEELMKELIESKYAYLFEGKCFIFNKKIEEKEALEIIKLV